jgi:hypothetical protein
MDRNKPNAEISWIYDKIQKPSSKSKKVKMNKWARKNPALFKVKITIDDYERLTKSK